MESVPNIEEAGSSSATILQDLIADEVKQQVKSELAAILDLIEEPVAYLLRAETIVLMVESALWCTMPRNTSFSIRPRRPF